MTRVVPCPQCLSREVSRQKTAENTWCFLNPDLPDVVMSVAIPDSAPTSQSATGSDCPAPVEDEAGSETRGRARYSNFFLSRFCDWSCLDDC